MANNSYSPLFHTVYDETAPVGHIGRGTHYSILSAPQWFNNQYQHESTGKIQRLAVIWDEDHDTRVIRVMERAYLDGLLAPVVYIGERKGFLTIGVDDINFNVSASVTPKFIKSWESLAENETGGDNWPLEVFFLSADSEYSSIISDDESKVKTYLRNINNLWRLGSYPFVPESL